MDFLTEQIDEQDATTIDRLIRQYCRPNMVVFELGTYTGKSALAMLPHIRQMNGKFYCVDWFRGNVEVEAEITTSYQQRNILDIFLSNIREAGYGDYVTVLVGTTDGVASIVKDDVADFIFIDADHRYSSVRNDLLNWYPKLKKGGLICGHDFEKHLDECDYNRVLEKCEEDFVDGCHYGVIRAVCEFFPDVRREGRIWYVQKGLLNSVARLMYRVTTLTMRRLLGRLIRAAMNGPTSVRRWLMLTEEICFRLRKDLRDSVERARKRVRSMSPGDYVAVKAFKSCRNFLPIVIFSCLSVTIFRQLCAAPFVA